jgi:hypothetical protein
MLFKKELNQGLEVLKILFLKNIIWCSGDFHHTGAHRTQLISLKP